MPSVALRNRTLWALLGTLLAMLSSVALIRGWPILFPEVTVKLPADPNCDLRAGPCVTELNQGGTVGFSIEPRELPTMKPLRLRVMVEGLQADNIEVDFSGMDMHMGFNRFKLQRDNRTEFSGEGMLPVCVWDAMEWEARVFIDSEQGKISVPFRFITVRQGATLLGARP
ncbi:MAG: hypothetical protein KME56_08175 [Candidatus Thiodiazotropha sp. (ex Ctena orbiculata)]|nr:hypothetical protein [Candidatus Thiodiazotropha taylori]PUB89995.1 MAG: hypothetical protein DBP00_00915 [gamma proteobacterium symbiont of Ctena orbiculata]MBT2996593.1 hypothetical protein [Candidatus Thiodiazotropha taylori]MBT3000633.1 hypothetical protein [Candidatus Thiodiazotropha taylori]MBT3026852.1 hypothetical protein [Candidatus Thiodiazotropha taylori]